MSKYSNDVIGGIFQFLPPKTVKTAVTAEKSLPRVYIKHGYISPELFSSIPEEHYEDLFQNTKWNKPVALMAFTASTAFSPEYNKIAHEILKRGKGGKYELMIGAFLGIFTRYVVEVKNTRKREEEVIKKKIINLELQLRMERGRSGGRMTGRLAELKAKRNWYRQRYPGYI